MEYDNKPFSLKLLKLEKRYRGKHVYKVIDSACRMFDLREDQFVDAIKTGGIVKDGQFGAPFVWAQSGQGVKLIAVGGEYHTKLVNRKKLAKKARERKRKSDPLTGKDLVPGRSYKDSHDNVFTYLGQCTCPVTGKKRYAVIEHRPYSQEGESRLRENIHLRSTVRTKKEVGDPMDLEALRSNEDGRGFTAANNYTSYVKQWEGGSKLRSQEEIFVQDFNGKVGGHSYYSRYYNTREWQQAGERQLAEEQACNRAFAAALVWHD